jgi:hypothetical protein
MVKVSRLGLGTGAVLALCFSAGVAHAEGPAAGTAAAPAAAEASAPGATASDVDVVRLKNGGLLRGKISELVPGDSVTIVTVTGKTREFKMSEVDYAGPSAKDPQAAPAPAATVAPGPAATSTDFGEKASEASAKDGSPTKSYVTVHGREARLHLISDEPGITFHRQTGSAFAVGAGGSAYATGYERICTTPCDVSLPAGTETLALSRGEKPPISAEPVTLPAGQSEMRGTLESRAGIRAAGWVVAIGGAVVGSVLMFTATKKEQNCDFGVCNDTTTLDAGKLVGGAVIMGAGLGIGIAMVAVRDKAVVEVNPQSGAAQRPLALARGISLHGHF